MITRRALFALIAGVVSGKAAPKPRFLPLSELAEFYAATALEMSNVRSLSELKKMNHWELLDRIGLPPQSHLDKIPPHPDEWSAKGKTRLYKGQHWTRFRHG